MKYWNIYSPSRDFWALGQSFKSKKVAEKYLPSCKESLARCNKGRVANGHPALVDDYEVRECPKAHTVADDIAKDMVKMNAEFARKNAGNN